MRQFLLVLALFVVAPACAPTPPPNTYTGATARQYNVTPLKQGILALSQTAIQMNASTGQTHLTVADTTLVRDFALSANATIDSYVNGNGTLGTVKTAFDNLMSSLSADAKNATLKAALATLQTTIDAIPLGAL